MGPNWLKLLLVVLLVVALFGRGRISDMMGDLAKGIKSFKKGISEDDEKPLEAKSLDADPPARIEAPSQLAREDARAG